MSKDVFIFKRVERKYFLDEDSKRALLALIGDRLTPDEHGKSTVCNLYLDTPSFLLIRNSIDARDYKEKLRVRSYGRVNDDSKVFFEIKKKYKGTVYKRRESMTYGEAVEYVFGGGLPRTSQIMREIDYFMDFYGHPKPVMLVSYERDAYFAPDEDNLRITFDTDVRYRSDALDLEMGAFGKAITDPDAVIMEIKTEGAMPLWLARILSETKTYPGRFSKYGRSYTDMIEKGEASNDRIYEAVICR